MSRNTLFASAQETAERLQRRPHRASTPIVREPAVLVLSSDERIASTSERTQASHNDVRPASRSPSKRRGVIATQRRTEPEARRVDTDRAGGAARRGA